MNSPSADNETTPVDSRTAAISPITTFVSQPQPMWSTTFQRYLITLWNAQHGRYYRQHYIEGQGWVFFDWLPVGQETVTASGGGPAGYGRGEMVYATYSPANPHPTSHYETLDPSFYVRGSAFFEEGKVFSILFTEPASANALNGLNPMADYNTNLSKVKYDEYVHTQVRRFIVVKRKREFCFAVPIFTYYGKATTKSGVVADEHAIAYSLGQQPQLVQGESPLRKAPIPIVMEENNRTLVPASRIYFAIHHPIQYNVKVKNLGHVHPDYLPTFLGYWNQENSDSKQDPEVTQDPNNTDRF
ncbi:hypothetical protein BKA58DRAFT_322204 [Alternaria rosae]|uniref:uncharacterized protein n=1 Tax=Alternaria rosae TaxID=1187941 RepID=UPI001E8CE0C8|nr:uncharacterized protein BKA58DRAFT_322204 [Alternaria rosae]KAH6865201.1 hypothetical protein BKA58DRAFT_322204 [Alternaria rosae]